MTLAAAVLLSTSAVAAPPVQSPCDLTGTWYGGSDSHTPYQLEITRSPDGKYYTAVGQQALNWLDYGYYNVSAWTGTIAKSGSGYTTTMMSMARLTREFAAELGLDPTLPELDVVFGTMWLSDCDTLHDSLSAYYIYNEFDALGDRIPFVTPPDFDLLTALGLPPIAETYHRLPSTCPICGTAPKVAKSSSALALEPRPSRVPPIKR